jgi:hypothetical protein
LVTHKIGHTKYLWRRIRQLRLELDPQIERLVSYPCVVSSLLLEVALHTHFRKFHFVSDKSKELFKLPEEEVAGFEATTAAIESHLLRLEIWRLKTLLKKFQAECLAADASGKTTE